MTLVLVLGQRRVSLVNVSLREAERLAAREGGRLERTP